MTVFIEYVKIIHGNQQKTSLNLFEITNRIKKYQFKQNDDNQTKWIEKRIGRHDNSSGGIGYFS